MKIKSLIKHNLMRAAMTLALILACATAWADNDPVSYIAANGSTQTCTDYTVLHTGDNVSNLPGGWYVVSENVEFNSQLYFSGSASIILCDGKTLTVNSGNYNSINVNYALTIYGQSGQSGTLNATCNSGTNSPCIYARNDITINGGIVSVNGEIGIRGPVITINRGTVTSTGNLIGIWATNNVIINGGKVRATGDSYGVMANNNITLGWTNYSDFINANSYYAVDGSVAIATGKTLYDDATAYSGTLTSDQIQAIVGQTLCPYSTNDFTVNTDSTEYTIHTATGWDVFCDALQDNNTWNHFSGKTVKLGADISITQSAGSAGNEFMGTFDGDGKTLTVDITETTTQGTAPFREIKGATIQNLVVTGSVVGTIHAAGLVGFARGADASTVNTITNCKVATNVTVTTPSGNNYHCGGVVGHAFHCTLNMSNTVYCGDITNSGNYVGGLQGWSDGNTINFSHCLFVGSYSGTTTGTALFHPVAVRYNNSATTADVSHVYYTATPTLTNSNYIAADGTKTTGRTTAPDNLGSQEVTYSFMGMTLYENGLFYNGLYYVAPTLSTDNSGAYLISSVDDWTNFCDMLYDNATWDRFIGKTVKLGANITVTQMAGGSNHAFTGTFDGNHKTLTLNYGTVQAPIDAEFVAPFVEVSGGAEFINLNIDGHIYAAYTGSSDPGVGGLIGHLFGGITIEGCTSTVEINSTTDRVGGFVGLCEQAVTFTNCKSSAVVTCTGSGSGFVGWSRDSNYTIAFYGCLFNGKILKKNGVGSGNGGFVGWKGYHKTVEITNCLVDPAAVAEGETMADDNSATFCRYSADTSLDNQATTITNCYYTETFGNAQGNQAHSISGGDYVTVGNAGTASSEYTTSGLIFYNVGLKYGDVLYAAANDEVSLTLAHQDREGYDFIGYTATAGNLNGSSLTMPDGNVTINAEYTYTAPSELTVTDITFTTATLNWNGFQESYNVRYRTVGANEWQTIGGIAATTTTLSGLLSGTTYEWQVQGLDCNGEGGTTEWSEAGTFTTLSTCEVQPSELAATDITFTTATLNWNGLQESYSVRYRPAIVIFNEGFESGTMPDGWTRTGAYWQVTSGTGYAGYTGAATGNYNAGCYINNSNASDILITPVIDLGNVVSATLSFNFLNTAWAGDINILKVHYRVDEGEWHWLYTYENATGGWIPVTINLEGLAANYQIGFECENNYSYGMGIDDVKVIDNGAWTTENNVLNPFTLTGLTPETPYVWQVQGLDCNSEGSTTEWSEAGTFTTPNPCEAPSELTATDITATTATLNWNGLQESYNVRCHPAIVILNEGFESGTMPDGWTRTNEYWEVTSGTGFNYTGAATGNYNAGCYINNSNDSDTLITPVMDLSNVASATLSFNFWNTAWAGYINILKVYYRVDEGEWHWLYTNSNATVGWIPVTINLEGMAANYQIGFECESHWSYGMGIDDVKVTGINTSEWTTVTNVSSPHNLTGLTPETQYLWQVQGLDCYGEGSTTEWSEAGTFTTLPLPLPVSYIDENGQEQTLQPGEYTVLTGTETTLGTAGQETWYVVHSTLNYSQGIQLLGNTHIILCDGAAMNIGSSESPVSGSSYQEQVGFYGSGNNLSLYAQSGNTGALTIYSQSCSFDVKDLTIAGGNVNATKISNNYLVIGCTNNLTVCRSSLEIHANGQAVQAFNDVTLSNVTANIISPNGSGLVCSNFAVDNSQLTVTARYQAIQANVITLGCTAATDFIKATTTSSLTDSYYGTVKIADGQTLYAGTNAYTGTLTDAQRQAIGGQKLTNVAPPTYDYIGLDGTGATHTATVIDADYMPTSLSGWYIVQGTVNYTNTINLGGDTHIILADNAVMNVTASEGNYGIQSPSGSNSSLFVYGQTGQSGELNVTSNSFACFISGGDITIAGGKVTASGGIIGLYAQYTNNNGGNVTIKNATVTATGTSYFGIFAEYGGDITIDNSNVTATSTGSSGINAENGNITIASGTVTASGSSTKFGIYTVYGSVTINGGQVTTTGSIGIYTVYGSVTINGGQVMATGNIYGIYAQNSSDNITLGWTNPTDYIYVNKYYAGGTLSIAEGKTFIDEDGQTYSDTIAQADGAYPIDGKTLYPNCVVRKQVAGYGEGNGGWVFIASPVAENIAPSEVHNLLGSYDETTEKYDYDLYRFNQSDPNGKEWQNWNATTTENHPDFTSLVNGQGYLYATKNTKTLVFTGPFITDAESVAVGLEYDATDDHKCWNLVGNPFADTAYVDHDFYVMNALGSEIIAAERDYVNPMEGIFVKAEGEYDDTMIFSLQAPCKGQSSKPKHEQMVINLSRDRGSVIDRAIVRMGEGQTQPKFQINRNSTKLYIPQGGTDYAIITSNGQGELPLNFKAETDGTYTLSFNAEEVSFSYLHLIDNLTGADVDLLASPTYTFTAKTTDYESRFKLVFSTNDADDTSTGSETEDLRPDDVRTQKIVVE